MNFIWERSRLTSDHHHAWDPLSLALAWGDWEPQFLCTGQPMPVCQRHGCPAPSPRTWGVPWAGLAQAWHSDCTLRPGTSCTKEGLLKGQRSSWGAGTPAQPWQPAQAWAATGTPTLSPASSDLREEKEKQGPGSPFLGAGPPKLCEDRAQQWQVLPTWQGTGRRWETRHSIAWTLESSSLEFKTFSVSFYYVGIP